MNEGEGWHRGFEIIQFLIPDAPFHYLETVSEETCKLIAGKARRDQKPADVRMRSEQCT